MCGWLVLFDAEEEAGVAYCCCLRSDFRASVKVDTMTVTVEIEDENSGLLGNSSSKPLCEWRHSAVVVVASMLGTGVLGIPLALKQMGWTMGLCTIAVTLIMSMYSGILLGRLYRAGCGASSYADLTYEVFIRRFDHRWSVIAKSVVVLVAYSYLLGVACITVTAMQISLRELLWSVKLPHLVWLGVTMVFVFPFVQVRGEKLGPTYICMA